MTSTISCSITLCRVVPCTSMMGASPDTVTVCSRTPTAIAALTVAMNVPFSSMPSRRNDEKPGSENVTV